MGRSGHGRVRVARGWGRVALAAALVGLSCGGARLAPAQPLAGGAYRRPLTAEPATLDPARIGDIYGRGVAHQLFDGLVAFDQTLRVVPALARFWRASRDGREWTFSLRPGVRFHHGPEVTADDVVFSLSRLLDPKVGSGVADLFLGIRGAAAFREGRAREVAGLRALDASTVRVTLEEATVPFVSLLAVGQAKVVPRDLVEEFGEAFGTRPVGTGPFRFVRWERGKEIVLAANPDYFEGPPRLERVVYRIFSGAPLEDVYRAFLLGELEDSPLPVREYRQARADPRFQYVRRSLFTLRMYGFNTRVRPLDDRRVRQALVHAIDREAIVSEIFLGRFVLARGILPPGVPGYDPRRPGYPHDPERARELLAAAGYPAGRGLPPIAIWSSVRNEAILREHERIARELALVGVRAEFHYLPDWPEFLRGMAEGRFPVFLWAWFADVPDPENFLGKLFHSRSPGNYGRYANPAVDQLLLRARGEEDPLRRAELYRRAEDLVLEDAPVIPVWHQSYERLFQPYVRGVEVSGLGDPYLPLRKVWLEPPPRRP